MPGGASRPAYAACAGKSFRRFLHIGPGFKAPVGDREGATQNNGGTRLTRSTPHESSRADTLEKSDSRQGLTRLTRLTATTFGFTARGLRGHKDLGWRHGQQRSLPVHHGHGRRADRQSFDGLAAGVGLQWVAAWLHRRDKTRSEVASDLVFLVAGAGFEPATFGL